MKELSARIRLYREGGRRSAIRSGYIATLRIGGLYTAAGIYLEGLDQLEPGDSCDAKILLPNPEYAAGELTQGSRFFITEGATEVGEGVVTNSWTAKEATEEKTPT